MVITTVSVTALASLATYLVMRRVARQEVSECLREKSEVVEQFLDCYEDYSSALSAIGDLQGRLAALEREISDES